MPSPAKTTDAAIIAAARKLVEKHGRRGFSMQDVARLVGVRAPSLYGRFKHRSELIGAVELQLWSELAGALAAAPRSSDPTATLARQADAYRRFAKQNPLGYTLIYDAEAEQTEAGRAARAAALAISMPAFAALVGDSRAFAAARVLTPFLHGFVSMELAGAFRLGPDLDRAFTDGVGTILAGLASERRGRRRPLPKRRSAQRRRP
jgi:AcrR family transcriptional regulator